MALSLYHKLITGALDIVRRLAILDVTHTRRQLLDVLNTFPSSIQMLPSPLVMPEYRDNV